MLLVVQLKFVVVDDTISATILKFLEYEIFQIFKISTN
jgi:hypothetical protein